MKTLTPLTTCLILLFSSQTFSQDNDMSWDGSGGSDGGSVDVHVSQEDVQQGATPNFSANPNSQSTDTKSKNYWFPKNTQSVWNTPFISKVRPVDPVEKFRNRINTQDKVNSGTRPRISNKDWDIPSCPNNGNGTKKDGEQTVDPPFQMPPPYLCDCCCHYKSSRNVPLTTTSDDWDKDQTTSTTYTHDERYNDDRRNDNGGCKKTDIGIPPESEVTNDEQTHSVDDCDCNCVCRQPKGFAVFD